MSLAKLEELQRETEKLLDACWRDDRRHWCAYCGIPMRRKCPAGVTQPQTLATKDHVIPRAHKGGLVTVPACRECNRSKGRMSLQEYLETEHFKARRRNKHKNQWTIYTLWAVSGIAALKKAAVLQTRAKKPAEPFPSSNPLPERNSSRAAGHIR
jgi:5-methylcytosine-specific restriction endonuclease McrA